MSHWVVGLTGGIGVGKTTVADIFGTLGVDIIDADIAARQVVEPGTEALQRITNHFGSAVITQEGQLDRKALRTIIFDQPEQKNWLDNLLHPLIREKVIADVNQANSAYCILVAPLLIENGLTKLVNQVLVVDADETVQQQRAAKRDDTTTQNIAKIMQNQLDREARLKEADQVIANNGNKRELREKINELHDFYLNQVKKTLKS